MNVNISGMTSKNKEYTSGQQGFTLIELMVTIAILAILLGIAVPSFQSIIKKNTVESLQSNIVGAMATARTEAASRNKTITICGSTDGVKCADTNASWNTGWLIYEGDLEDTNPVAANVLIDDYKNESGYEFRATQSHFSFNSQGFLIAGSPSTVTICAPDDTDEKYARGIYVNTSGLVMKTRDTDGDNIHNDPSAGNTTTELSCD